MKKLTHLIFAFLLFSLFNFILNFQIYFSVFAFIGALFPDLDLGFYHRKLFHNLWILMIALSIGFYFSLIDKTVAIIFSIGFVSHLIADSMTHKGIMPLWPIEKPKFKGPIKTGSIWEYALMIAMLAVILLIGLMIRF